jgi:hypothetical protein
LFILTTSLYAGLDDKSLVLYLSFDEGEGGKAADGSIHGHDGELVKDPTWVDGQFGKALEFDGTKGQHVKVPINDTLQLREQFSGAYQRHFTVIRAVLDRFLGQAWRCPNPGLELHGDGGINRFLG